MTVGQPVLIHWQTSCYPGLLYNIQLSVDGGHTYRCNKSKASNSLFAWVSIPGWSLLEQWAEQGIKNGWH